MTADPLIEQTAMLRDRLRTNADITEKSLDFIDDEEMAQEAGEDIALWRESAAALDALAARVRELEAAIEKYEPEGWTTTPAKVLALKERVAELEAENERLRTKVEQLEEHGDYYWYGEHAERQRDAAERRLKEAVEALGEIETGRYGYPACKRARDALAAVAGDPPAPDCTCEQGTMTDPTCPKHFPGGRPYYEVSDPPAPETCQHRDEHFDRSICACGVMHYYCNDCGEQTDMCASPESPDSGKEQT